MSNVEKRIFNKEFNLPAETFGLYTQIWSVLTLFHKGEEVTDNSSFNQRHIIVEVMNCIKHASSSEQSYKSLLVSSQKINVKAVECIDLLFQNNQLLSFTTNKKKKKIFFGASLFLVIPFCVKIPTKEYMFTKRDKIFYLNCLIKVEKSIQRLASRLYLFLPIYINLNWMKL